VIRVVLADDQALVRAGFRMILRAEPGIDVVDEAANGHEAIAAVEEHRPDVVLMDVRMPELDGIQATARLAESCPHTRVLVLTTFDLDEVVFGALRAGASGFLLKDAPEERLLTAIRVVAEGGSLFAPAVTRRLVEQFARHSPLPAPASLGGLTAKETEVLTLIGRGLTNAEIGRTLFITENTVKTHVAHVLTKLDLRDRVQAVVLAYESGLIRPAPA
jgi:DNA-binding NarL/FixJ family response regulator